jgi:hypothetical protein
MVRIIIGAVAGLFTGSIASVLASRMNPARTDWDGTEVFMDILFGGGSLAAVGAVLGAVPIIVNAAEGNSAQVRSSKVRSLLGALAGFAWGSIAFLLLWAIYPYGDWSWEVNIFVIIGGGGPFATIGALLGTTWGFRKMMKEKERDRHLRHLSEASAEPDDLAQKT